MPFTVSHAFFAVPLRYIKPAYFSVTGLALGSMSPDFEYFLKMEPYRSIGHTWQGFWLQALPLSLLLAWLFHYIVKTPLALHSPSLYQLDARLYSLFKREQLDSWRAWIIFIGSVGLGFMSHVVLDEFTHVHSRFDAMFPWIWEETLLTLPLYKWLQYTFSMLGLAGLLAMLLYALRRGSAANIEWTIGAKRKLTYWLMVGGFAFLTTMVKLITSTSGNTLGILVVAPISGTILGVILSSMVWKIAQRLNSKS